MTIRTTISDAGRRAQTGASRCTVREFDDDHDIMEAKQADVMHSETPSAVQVHQPCGLTSHPMPQEEDTQKQPQQSQAPSGGGTGDPSNPDMSKGFNDNQPKGPSSIGHMSYWGGSRSNPVMHSVDDPRHRPFQTKKGEALFYSPDGSGQAVYHRRREDDKDGLYLVTLDDQQQLNRDGTVKQQERKRFISMRHVEKPRQQRKKQQQQQQQQGIPLAAEQQNYKHEGESVNTEVRCTKDRIEFRAGDTVVGYYDKGADTWHLKGKIVAMEATQRVETVGKTYLGLDSRGENAPKVATSAALAREAGEEPSTLPAKQTFAKV
jgi:hypothetical protein